MIVTTGDSPLGCRSKALRVVRRSTNMREDRAGRRLSWDRVLAGALIAASAAVVAWGVSIELQASPLQSRLFAKLARGFNYTVESGPNPYARFPESGPYDERLG